MMVWIFILSAYVALLVLILHDATKTDSNGSAVSIGARYFNPRIRRFIERLKWKSPAKAATEVIGLFCQLKEPAKNWLRWERRVSDRSAASVGARRSLWRSIVRPKWKSHGKPAFQAKRIA